VPKEFVRIFSCAFCIRLKNGNTPVKSLFTPFGFCWVCLAFTEHRFADASWDAKIYGLGEFPIDKNQLEIKNVENRRLSGRIKWPWRPVLLVALIALVIFKAVPPDRRPASNPAVRPNQPSRQIVAEALTKSLNEGVFPEAFPITVDGHVVDVNAAYTIQPIYQEMMEKLIRQYKPDYAAFVALEANTGRIIALISFTKNEKNDIGNLALRSSFPAASLFKIVTATAAIEEHMATPDTEISFNGANHTLYRRNVADTASNRWTRHMTLREAFAKSVNTVFAKLGLFSIKADTLRNYAERYQFNHFIASDLPVQPGQFMIADNNPWLVAEVASGFNRFVTISPIQGAMMAAAAANDGKLMNPYIVDTLNDDTGKLVYHAEPEMAGSAMSPETAEQIRNLMHETVQNGTSRKSFRQLLRKSEDSDVEMGGKTGSLTGTNPKGRYDWFVGFGRSANQRIAVAALTINEEKWRVKSSYLATYFIDHYFDISESR
jgi:penicillin-binding protein A